MNGQKNIIFGISSTSVTEAEKAFFINEQPLGFILFARNIQNPIQLKELITELKSLIDSPYVPILIDQEGGRVKRLKPPHFRETKAAGEYGKLAEKNLEEAKRAVFLNYLLMGKELLDLGINVNCAPVLDLLFDDAHTIIGDRSFGHDLDIVTQLGKYAIYGLMAAGVLPVIKHIPGHGRTKMDSHHELPVIETPLPVLEKTDFVPFKALNFAPIAMTAHIIISDIDPNQPITLSKKGIDYVRHNMGFDNIIITDALEMKALSGTLATRAKAACNAGCDVLIHCTGKLDEMKDIIAQTLYVNDNTKMILSHLDECSIATDLSEDFTQYLEWNTSDMETELHSLFSNFL